jgi:hypothetical protein
VYVKEIFGH